MKLLFSVLAFKVMGKRIFKDLPIFEVFGILAFDIQMKFKVKLSLLARKLFRIPEPYEQMSKRTTQGTFLQKISPVAVVVSEQKMLKEKLTRTHTRGRDLRSERISF
jgi:hypothetical protein